MTKQQGDGSDASDRAPLSRRAWLRTVTTGVASLSPAASWLAAPVAGCSLVERIQPRRPSEPDTSESLLDRLPLADVDHHGPFIELGSAAKDRHILGGWRTGWGEDVEADAERGTFVVANPAIVWLELPDGAGPWNVSVRARAAQLRHVRIVVADTTVAEHELPPTGWADLQTTVPESLAPPGPWRLELAHDGTDGERAFAVASIHVKRVHAVAQGDAPLLDKLGRPFRGQPALRLSPSTRLSFHINLDTARRLTGRIHLLRGQHATVRIGQHHTSEPPETLSEVDIGHGERPQRLETEVRATGLTRLTVEMHSSDPEAHVAIVGPTLTGRIEQAPRPARPTRAEHVLVILCDTLRADRLRAYAPDSRVHTPTLDAFAEQAHVVERCITPANWTKPSVASLLTGRIPARHGALGQDDLLQADIPYAPEWFQRAGFATAGFVANGFISEETGFARGFDHFTNYIDEVRRNRVTHVMGDALAWIEAHRHERSFVYVHCVDPHVPYDPPGEDLARYDRDPYEGPIEPRQTGYLLDQLRAGSVPFEARDRRRLQALYDGEVTFFDRGLGTFLDALRDSGWLDEALTIFVADHGEEFFDHGSVGHGHQLYEELLHVPLFIRPPGPPTSRARLPALVTLQDLTPTIYGAAGIEAPPDADRRNLGPELGGASAPSDLSVFASQWAPARGDELKWAARTEDHKLWMWGPREVHLHDLADDPAESREAAPTIAHRALMARLGAHIGAFTRKGRVSGRAVAAPFSDELCEQLRALGYLDVGRCGD